MDREERRLKRQQDTRRATVIFAVFAVVVIAAVAGAAFGISRFVGSKAKEKPQTEAVNPGQRRRRQKRYSRNRNRRPQRTRFWSRQRRRWPV